MRNAVTPEVLELVIRGDYKDPFTVLGMHSEKGKLIVRALLPQAVSVAVVDSSTGKKISLRPCLSPKLQEKRNCFPIVLKSTGAIMFR